MAERRLGVIGDPVAHSLSPALHAAAYRALGLEWQYEAVRVKEGTLRGFVDGLDESWRGLSVTMPLKREALAYVGEAHPVAVATRAVNTILLDGPRSVGFNTDVHGIVEALRGAGSESPERVRILGAGATAGSLLAALASLGVTRAEILARSVERAQGLREIADRVGVTLDITELGGAAPRHSDLVVSTLPGTAALEETVLDTLTASAAHALLFDIAYDPWPTPLAAAWERLGGRTASGLDMLLHQAVQQVRVFALGSLDTPLDDEARVIDAMRRTLDDTRSR